MEHSVREMRKLVQGVEGISAKIRLLGAAGYERADIARFLGKRYQHVRNVLEQEKAKKERDGGRAAEPQEIGTAKVRVGPDGRIVIPVGLREAVGLKDGDTLWARIVDDEIRLSTARGITRRVRSLVREHIPEGVSLVDELIAERRRESDREPGR